MILLSDKVWHSVRLCSTTGTVTTLLVTQRVKEVPACLVAGVLVAVHSLRMRG